MEGYSRISVEIYDDLNADSNGSFGSGEGFKNGAIYIPNGSKITLDLRGHTINRGSAGDDANSKAVYADAGSDFKISNGTVIGGVHVDKKANATIDNVYVTERDAENGNSSAYTASIFGEGSLAMIVVILTFVASCISIFLTVHYNKKKETSVTGNNSDSE